MSAVAVILAAGRSTRLKSRRPKPLHEVCGRPMLHYVLQAAYGAECNKALVVVGHGKDEIIAAFAEDQRIVWVEQGEQLGTGHAVKMCEKALKKVSGDVFLLAGDGPLIRAEVLQTLRNVHRDERAAATLATAVLSDASGYGRVVRDEKGEFAAIVEDLDATEEQRAIREIYPSYACVKSEELTWACKRLSNDNRKGEYYLTDIFRLLQEAGRKVVAVEAVAEEDVLSINTRQQLAEVDALMQERIQRRIRDGGVTIVSSAGTYIEDGVSVGADTVIGPLTFIGRDSSIGPGCTIGPMVRIPRASLVPEGTVLGGDEKVSG